ncbi:MAG: GNAT family N-acetyltransferase, partial [Chloroflexi bacterium]|nr:GNAT family N-acetyltransferase [Chloroflexota bacterium]
PGLPGSSPEKDLELSRQLFSDDRFRPDGLKLYPTMVVAGTELEKWHRAGCYQPYPADTMTQLLIDIKSIVPGYVRISRVLRDIPSKFIVGGLRDSLRDVIKERMKQLGIDCQCIRCREYGHRLQDGWETGKPGIVRTDYTAAGGRETFLSCEDERGTLFGLLRLRIQNKPVARLGQGLKSKTALIRELHVYGTEVPLQQQDPAAAQHKGLGKALLAEAERIARQEFRAQQMAILSGVGAREYYRTEFGYNLHADYMVKNL